MSKEEFFQLQSGYQQSGLSMKSYLRQAGTSYSAYNYWRKKYLGKDDGCLVLAPVSFRQPVSGTSSSFAGDVPGGATLLFPNGLRAHFGAGTEDVLRDLLYKSLTSHVLP